MRGSAVAPLASHPTPASPTCTVVLLQVLSGGRASPAALRGLCGLQRYYLDQWGEGPGNAELPEGPWLAGLRWLGSSAGSLVLSTAALSAAPSLELVEVVASNSKAVDWSSPAAANFFDWLARHPPLHRVLLRKKYGATVFDAPAFEAHVEQLRLRRPGLLLERVGPTEGTMQALLTDE